MTDTKTAIIYDQELDRSRRKLITDALQEQGYTVLFFNQDQGHLLLQVIEQKQPDLVVTSSMSREQPRGGLVIGHADKKAGAATVLFSLDTGHGSGQDDQRRLNKAGIPAGFYQYNDSKGFDTAIFMRIVGEAVAAKQAQQSAASPQQTPFEL